MTDFAAMMLLTLDRFDPAQRVAVVSELLTVECPTCGGSGLMSYGDRTIGDCPNCKGDGRVPFTGRVAIAVPCDTCLRHPAFEHSSPVPARGCERCNGLGYLVVASADVTAVVPIVERNLMRRTAPPFVSINTPTGALSLWRAEDHPHPWERIDDQFAFATFTPGAWAVLLDNVATVEERCPGCGRTWDDCKRTAERVPPCVTCVEMGTCPPIPVAGGGGYAPFREWTP